jgi:hypothetical protein
MIATQAQEHIYYRATPIFLYLRIRTLVHDLRYAGLLRCSSKSINSIKAQKAKAKANHRTKQDIY